MFCTIFVFFFVSIFMFVLAFYFIIFLFFFFKQKTAYEMRISDWSSDVCSSDLFADRSRYFRSRHRQAVRHSRKQGQLYRRGHIWLHNADRAGWRPHGHTPRPPTSRTDAPLAAFQRKRWRCAPDCHHSRQARSEEHTSELQSLMRISYAVFCLKK